MKWFEFKDCHSGGYIKVPPYDYIFIEMQDDDQEIDAINIFGNRFNFDPRGITCTCCGEDYFIEESTETLAQITGCTRNCRSIFNPDSREFKYLEKDEEIPEGWELGSMQPWGDYISLFDFLEREDVFVLPYEEQTPADRRIWEGLV